MGMERGHHLAQSAAYSPEFIGSKLIIGTVDALAGAGKTFHGLSGSPYDVLDFGGKGDVARAALLPSKGGLAA
jgi:hypothetical protein